MEKKTESVGAIWKRTINTKNGEVEILSIVIGDKKFVAWPNTFKKPGEKSPDYRLQIDTYEPRQQVPSVQSTIETKDENDLPF